MFNSPEIKINATSEEGNKDTTNYLNPGYYLDNLGNVVWYSKG